MYVLLILQYLFSTQILVTMGFLIDKQLKPLPGIEPRKIGLRSQNSSHYTNENLQNNYQIYNIPAKFFDLLEEIFEMQVFQLRLCISQTIYKFSSYFELVLLIIIHIRYLFFTDHAKLNII